MRLIRKVTSDEENFRLEPVANSRLALIRRDPIEPEPVGTLLLIPFRVVGYDPDCDGSLMARLEMMSLDEVEHLEPPDSDYCVLRNYGLYPPTGFVVSKDELLDMVAAQFGKEVGEIESFVRLFWE